MRTQVIRRGLVAAAVVTTAVGVCVGPLSASPGATSGGNAASSDKATQAGVDSTSALVQLKGDPLSTNARTKPAQGKKIDFSSSAVKSERAALSALRNDFKAWLRTNAPKAQIVNEYDLALNAVAVRLNGTPLDTLRGAPQVTRAEYERTYTIADSNDPDLSLVHAVQAWRSSQVGGDANAGKGVKIGIIDTGVDQTHPCFSDAGFPATTQLGDKRFTNNKVIVAKVFNMKGGQQGYTPEAVQEHGTHVAGTVACNLDTPAVVNGVDVPYDVSGVAPAAQVGNYNVFPADVQNVRNEDLVDAMEEAYVDGMDVINMSIGGNASGAQDLGTVAVDNLDRANMVVAVAAGNSGPGHYTVESAGSAERALTAGASTVGHFVGAAITVGATTYRAATGDFPVVSSPLTAALGVVTGTTNGLGLACDTLPAGSLTGKIAVVSRGSCSFATKIRKAQDAGAVAAVVVNNVAGDPIAMGGDAAVQPAPTIPAYMVDRGSAAGLVAANGQSATIDATLAYFRTGNDNIMAGFSSQGPTDTSARRVKPDVVAPGVNVLSSIPTHLCGGSPDCWTFLQGTSMATPHLAGMAGVVRGAHPTWTAEQVRSAIVNTAAEGVLTRYTDGTTVERDVNVTGAGLANLLAAVGARIAVGPVSTSFGTIPGGSGQTRTATVVLTSLTGAAQTVSLSVDSVQGAGVTFTAPSSVTIPATGSTTITVTATSDKGAAAGDHSADLRFAVGGVEIAHSVLYAYVG
ncbi:S8 family serine peptidase [Saccharothrix variisporea]|uniref:PA domain-containing protein n=1 Tax=Saccharothrix variisporea TaxID=543527 RepID=A0A495X5B7_9PSEU|nr:S8 family serine peptidase [Saccharothrix variisporea]RKT69127.1 PA domain-containing protein [Saccharothrix variisporea]